MSDGCMNAAIDDRFVGINRKDLEVARILDVSYRALFLNSCRISETSNGDLSRIAALSLYPKEPNRH
jgi:hypothetical protein